MFFVLVREEHHQHASWLADALNLTTGDTLLYPTQG